MSLSVPFPFFFSVAAEQKGVEIKIHRSLSFSGIAFISDIAIFVLTRDVKLQLTNLPSTDDQNSFIIMLKSASWR